MARHSQNRSDTKASMPDSSPARLAAEAAFTQRPIARAAHAEPQVVVIKRKQATVPAGEGDPVNTESQQPMKVGRTPRVFRIDSAVEQPQAPGATTGPDASVGVGTSLTAQAVQIKRRRSRIPRAEVTIIRPAAVAGVAGDPQASRDAETPLQDLKSLEPCSAALRAAQHFDLGIATSGASAASRYQALRARIEQLERRAEAARRIEAARAVRWIKRAIAAYDLRASDLGL
jgi:hypothetical protein